jgi:thioredoxin reductase
MSKPRIAILGAGPTGLEAALTAADNGFPFTVYEVASSVAGNVRSWGHVRLFTPWEMNVSPRMRRHLEAAGREVPAGSECPTGRELAEKLFEPLAALPGIAPNLRLGVRVLDVGRQGLLKHEEIATETRGRHPFRLLLADESGREWTETADLVIDATGTWGHPNPLGDGGIPAPGERRHAEEIRRDIPDFATEEDWAGKTVLLAGAGHSAQTAVRALAELPGTRVIWALRNPEPGWGTHDGDPLPDRARLAADAAALASGSSPNVEVKRGAVVEEIAKPNGRFQVTLRNGHGPETVEVDRVLSLTGSVGDHGLYRQLQVHEPPCWEPEAPTASPRPPTAPTP